MCFHVYTPPSHMPRRSSCCLGYGVVPVHFPAKPKTAYHSIDSTCRIHSVQCSPVHTCLLGDGCDGLYNKTCMQVGPGRGNVHTTSYLLTSTSSPTSPHPSHQPNYNTDIIHLQHRHTTTHSHGEEAPPVLRCPAAANGNQGRLPRRQDKSPRCLPRPPLQPRRRHHRRRHLRYAAS